MFSLSSRILEQTSETSSVLGVMMYQLLQSVELGFFRDKVHGRILIEVDPVVVHTSVMSQGDGVCSRRTLGLTDEETPGDATQENVLGFNFAEGSVVPGVGVSAVGRCDVIEGNPAQELLKPTISSVGAIQSGR